MITAVRAGVGILGVLGGSVFWRGVFLGGVLLAASGGKPAWAASFPCAKAATATEKAICQNPELSELDSEMGAAWKKALDFFRGQEASDDSGTAPLRQDQKAWLGRRNACGGNPECLRTLYHQRLAALVPIPSASPISPVEVYVGRFSNKGLVDLVVLMLEDGRLLVGLSGAEPERGRWVCNFSGMGTLQTGQQAGPELKVRDFFDDKNVAPVFLSRTRDGMKVEERGEDTSGVSYWCGRGGSLNGHYTRVSPTALPAAKSPRS